MKIKELELNNFRSFRGITKFNFDTNEENNIILIGGENGSGKTSIFEAIKLCIYGPLTLKYRGVAPNYIALIKSMINKDSLKNVDIKSHVQLKILMNIGNEVECYSIKREWVILRGKFTEEFTVYKKDKKLEGEKKEVFESYLKNTIPPDVFDLFFFNGEKLSEFFDERSFETRIKDAILTLNNFDILNILKRELNLNIRRKDRGKQNLREFVEKLELVENDLDNIQEKLNIIVKNISFCENLKEELTVKIDIINNEFIKAGGINKKEREMIANKINIAENKRELLNQSIKEFSNDVLPFIIVKDMLLNIKEQIYLEDDYNIFDVINSRLDNNVIAKIISNNMESKLPMDFESIAADLRQAIIPQNFDKDFKLIHNLSKEQRNRVLSYIDTILKLDIRKINYFDEIAQLTEDIANFREKLNNSLIDEEHERYIKKINIMRDKLNSTEVELVNLINKKDILDKEKIDILSEYKRLSEKINMLKQAENVKDKSNLLIQMIEALLIKITDSKKNEIERYFAEIFNKIIGKEKYIDFIYVENDFKISLYLKKAFYNDEIKRMVINLGIEEIEKKFGKLFIEGIYNYTGHKDKRNIMLALNKQPDTAKIELDTKVDVMNLSSGEKQVYILSLYWALIKSSGLKVPFIIDTPYGRIDEKHRRSITTEFFSKISEQVIILSTDTEIEEGLYRDINKYISKEYILEYDVNDRKTIIDEGYFYEVV